MPMLTCHESAAIRLDAWYVPNWSMVLDRQDLPKTLCRDCRRRRGFSQ